MSEALLTPPREGFRAFAPGHYEFRAAENGSPPILSGHAAVWDSWTEIDSKAEGNFMEKLSRGSFRKTLQESRDKVRVLYSHGRGQLGDMVLGKIKELCEDPHGLFYSVDLFDGVPQLLLDGLRNGQYGSSFRFRTIKEGFDPRPPRSAHNPKGLPERVLQEVQLVELGPTPFAAYADATAGLRSLTDELMPVVPGEVQISDSRPEWYLGDRPDWYLE